VKRSKGNLKVKSTSVLDVDLSAGLRTGASQQVDTNPALTLTETLTLAVSNILLTECY